MSTSESLTNSYKKSETKISSLFRPVIQELADGYDSVPNLDDVAAELNIPISQIVKLDAGENPFLTHPNIDWRSISEKLGYYPDPSASELRSALSEDLGMSDKMIAVGNGSDELIDLICRLFLEDGRKLVDFPPTFAMYKIFAQVTGASLVEVLRKDDFSLNLDRSIEALKVSDLTFLANPNNPTGTVIDEESIESLLKTGKPVVVDEAYYEFYGQTVLPLMNKYENLIVLRTFSKWAGLAGARIGYVIANQEVINKFNAVRAPYNTNQIGQVLAKEVLANKINYMDQIKGLVDARDVFIDKVNTLKNWQAIPSHASCVCLVSLKRSSADAYAYLRKRGILVRNINSPALPNVLRISIAPSIIMERLFSALEELDN